jgi:hypothetical protein
LTTREKWEQSIALCNRDLTELETLIGDENTDLFTPVACMHNTSVFQEVLLVINHTAYHAGEFIMTRQTFDFWESLLSGSMRD